ncbi:MAG: hypothetical protein JSR34_11370 [Proteobacteria bacterium]|nr:hypothetical protein [Pseudomonadota bacterium]
MPRRFDITPPARDPRMLVALMVLLPTVVALALVYALVKPTPPAYLPLPIVVFAAVNVLLVSRWIEKLEVSLDGAMLHLVAGNSKLDVAIADIDLQRARVLRLDEHPEYKTFLRTGGIGLPGLALGWFRNRALLRMFCILTDRARVLALPLRDGKQVVLLSLKRPDDLLAALRDGRDRTAYAR